MPLEHSIKLAIVTTDAPAAIGPYSQAIRTGDTVFTSGQVALDPATGNLVPGGINAALPTLRLTPFLFRPIVGEPHILHTKPFTSHTPRGSVSGRTA